MNKSLTRAEWRGWTDSHTGHAIRRGRFSFVLAEVTFGADHPIRVAVQAVAFFELQKSEV